MRKKTMEDIINELREDNERLRGIVNEVESLHYGTDLFTSCAAGEADRLIELIEREVGDDASVPDWFTDQVLGGDPWPDAEWD